MKNYITEFIGTFFLVFVIGLTVSSETIFAPIAIGSILMVMVYMGGHISGAHYNPAVTLACLIRGVIEGKEAALYVVSQVLGAIVAAGISCFIMGKSISILPGDGVGNLQALAVEVLFTFALASVVLNVATSKDHENNSFYGLAIGFTVLAAALAGGPISGGAFNPAVAIGHNFISKSFGILWLYLVGPLTGGALAAIVFKLTNPKEFE